MVLVGELCSSASREGNEASVSDGGRGAGRARACEASCDHAASRAADSRPSRSSGCRSITRDTRSRRSATTNSSCIRARGAPLLLLDMTGRRGSAAPAGRRRPPSWRGERQQARAPDRGCRRERETAARGVRALLVRRGAAIRSARRDRTPPEGEARPVLHRRDRIRPAAVRMPATAGNRARGSCTRARSPVAATRRARPSGAARARGEMRSGCAGETAWKTRARAASERLCRTLAPDGQKSTPQAR